MGSPHSTVATSDTALASSDSVAEVDDTAETGLQPSDTGSGEDSACPPADTGQPRTPALAVLTYLTGDEPYDFAGEYVDVEDVDSDGVAEAAVAVTFAAAPLDYPYTYENIHTGVYLLQDAFPVGTLLEGASIVYEGWGHVDYYGSEVALLPGRRQVMFGGGETRAGRAKIFEVPPVPPAQPIPTEALTGAIVERQPYTDWGVGKDMQPCHTSSGAEAVCVSASRATEDLTDHSGATLLYELPIIGEREAQSYLARYVGDAGDKATVLHGSSDFDGDGLDDLLVGALLRGGHGAVGLVTFRPDGEHRLWDIASASFVGRDNSDLGAAITSSDVDGDGHSDAVVGAPLRPLTRSDPGAAYVFRGPMNEERRAESADWTILGTEPYQLLGRGLAGGDFDGDGAGDLAIGGPHNWYVSDMPPGSVAVFLGIAPGCYTDRDAAVRLVSGNLDADSFGYALGAGESRRRRLGRPGDRGPQGRHRWALCRCSVYPVWFGAIERVQPVPRQVEAA